MVAHKATRRALIALGALWLRVCVCVDVSELRVTGAAGGASDGSLGGSLAALSAALLAALLTAL
jgi:hypothetical protein